MFTFNYLLWLKPHQWSVVDSCQASRNLLTDDRRRFNYWPAGLGKITKQAIYVYRKHWGAFALQVLPWKSNEYYSFWVCVFSLSYPACTAHAPIILSSVVCLALPHLSTLSHQRRIFDRNLLSLQFVFCFSLYILSKLQGYSKWLSGF